MTSVSFMKNICVLLQFTFSRIDLMTVSAAISEICTIGSVSLSQADSGLVPRLNPISEEHFSIHKHFQSSGQLDTMKGNLNSLSNGFRCSLISPDVPSQVQSSGGSRGRCELYATVHVKRSSIFVTNRLTCTWHIFRKKSNFTDYAVLIISYLCLSQTKIFLSEENINDRLELKQLFII